MFQPQNSTFFSIDELYQVGNAGGLLNKIRLIPTPFIESLQLPTLGEVVLPPDALKLKVGSGYVDIWAAHNSAVWTQEMQITPEGEPYQVQLAFDIPKERPSLARWFQRYAGYEFLAMVEDRNGYVRLLGTLEQPLRITQNSATTAVRAAKNGRKTTLSALVEQQAYLLDGQDNAFDVAGLLANSTLDDVLLSALKSGKIALQFKEVVLPVTADNQTEFVVPAALTNKPIVNFSVNHLPYSEGIEYIRSSQAGQQTIHWLNVDFMIATTDLVQIKYLDILTN